MMQRTGEAETITTHYLAALGVYRALYIPNWIYRYYTEGTVDPIAIVAGIVQTGLYLDFFYVYVTKVLQGQKFELPAWDFSHVFTAVDTIVPLMNSFDE